MTGTKCNIKLCSKQKMGSETETTNEEYAGSFIDRGSKRYLSYSRVMPEGQKVDCLISFEHNKLTMTQKGDIQSKLEFAPGARTRNAYNTPMGMMTIVIHTKRLVMEQKDKEINLIIDYDLEAGGEPINTIITIKATIE